MNYVLDQIPEKITNFFIKVILVALVAMSIKIAIQMKKEQVSLMNIILSFIIGVGIAGLTGNLILDNFTPSWAPVIIGSVTIVGEKIGNFLIYTFKVDALIQDLIDYLVRKNKKE